MATNIPETGVEELVDLEDLDISNIEEIITEIEQQTKDKQLAVLDITKLLEIEQLIKIKITELKEFKQRIEAKIMKIKEDIRQKEKLKKEDLLRELNSSLDKVEMIYYKQLKSDVGKAYKNYIELFTIVNQKYDKLFGELYKESSIEERDKTREELQKIEVIDNSLLQIEGYLNRISQHIKNRRDEEKKQKKKELRERDKSFREAIKASKRAEEEQEKIKKIEALKLKDELNKPEILEGLRADITEMEKLIISINTEIKRNNIQGANRIIENLEQLIDKDNIIISGFNEKKELIQRYLMPDNYTDIESMIVNMNDISEQIMHINLNKERLKRELEEKQKIKGKRRAQTTLDLTAFLRADEEDTGRSLEGICNDIPVTKSKTITDANLWRYISGQQLIKYLEQEGHTYFNLDFLTLTRQFKLDNVQYKFDIPKYELFCVTPEIASSSIFGFFIRLNFARITVLITVHYCQSKDTGGSQ